MARYLLWTFLCLAPLAHAAPETQTDAAHDLAYSLGASLGERLREEVPDLQLDALIEGLRAAYQGKPLTLSDARIEQVLTEHQSRIDAASSQPDIERALSAEHAFLAKEKALPHTRELADGRAALTGTLSFSGPAIRSR